MNDKSIELIVNVANSKEIKEFCHPQVFHPFDIEPWQVKRMIVSIQEINKVLEEK